MTPTPALEGRVPKRRDAAGTIPGSPLANWIQALRARFYIATVIPVTAGLLLAANEGRYDPGLALVTLLGALAMHVGTNLANDYYDWVQYTGDLPYHGGSGVIQEGKIPPEAVRRAAWTAFAGALAAGVYLSTAAGSAVLAFTALGLFGAVFYSAPPVRFGYRGLAEVVCGLSMGPLIVLGTYYIQTGSLSPVAVAAALPLASFVAFILYGESIPDIDEDRQTGKWTLAARLGEDRALRVYGTWVIATGLVIVGLAATGLLPVLLLLELIVIALVLRALRPLLAAAGTGRQDRSRLSRLGKMALGLYLSTGLLLIAGLILQG